MTRFVAYEPAVGFRHRAWEGQGVRTGRARMGGRQVVQAGGAGTGWAVGHLAAWAGGSSKGMDCIGRGRASMDVDNTCRKLAGSRKGMQEADRNPQGMQEADRKPQGHAGGWDTPMDCIGRRHQGAGCRACRLHGSNLMAAPFK